VDRSGLWWTSYYYRAHGPTSRFPLVRKGGGPTTIELTWRSPALGSGETAGTILVDGDPIGELRPNTEWKTERFEMPTAETPARGVSWIEIRWPPALLPGSEGIEAAARDVERGIPFLLLPVFAEVHSFHALSGSVPADG
jgi:hypothetical protein